MTEKTNIEYFNEYMKLFVIEIRDIFPEFNEIIDGYYSELLSVKPVTTIKHVKRFMRKLKGF